MKTLAECYKELLEEQGMNTSSYDWKAENTEYIRLQVKGDNGFVTMCAIFMEEESLCILYSNYNKIVPKEKYKEVALWIAEVNFNLKIGSLELNTKNGLLMFRHSQYLFYKEERQIKDILLFTMKLNLTAYEEYDNQVAKMLSNEKGKGKREK